MLDNALVGLNNKIFEQPMNRVTIDVLDLANGKSELETNVLLEFLTSEGWQDVAHNKIDFSGSAKELVSETQLPTGIYRLSIHTKALEMCVPYPYIPIVFEVSADRQDYQISLMISATGYTVNID